MVIVPPEHGSKGVQPRNGLNEQPAHAHTQLTGFSVLGSSSSFNEALSFCWELLAWDTIFKDDFKPVKNVTEYQPFRFLEA